MILRGYDTTHSLIATFLNYNVKEAQKVTAQALHFAVADGFALFHGSENVFQQCTASLESL